MKVKISEVSESTVWNSKRNVCLLYEDEERSLAAIYYISVLIYKLLCLLTMPPCTTSILIFQLGAIMSAEIDLWILCLACWRTMYTQGLCLSNPSLAFFLPQKSWNSSWGGFHMCSHHYVTTTPLDPSKVAILAFFTWDAVENMHLPSATSLFKLSSKVPINEFKQKGQWLLYK